MVDQGFSWFPEQASSFAAHVDYLYFFLIVISTLVALGILVFVVYFSVKYRRGSAADRTVSHNHMVHMAIEVTWIAIPFFILMGVFVWSAAIFYELETPPVDAMEVAVIGKQWMWKFQHPSGRREINELHVPLGRSVKLKMISEDVIHDVYVPAFRMKHDVLPGQFTYEWFRATQPGEYYLFCAEYCGTDHSLMKGRVFVLDPGEYEEWLKTTAPQDPPAVAGGKLFDSHSCANCHKDPGVEAKGPSLVGLFGKRVKLDGGRTQVADEAYLRESILRPATKVVAGYKPIMPPSEGLVSEEELNDLIAYLKSLGGPGESEAKP